MILGGYFPKRRVPGPAWLQAPHVREVCSVSECVSPGPPDWISRWRHNDWGWYNARDEAVALIPAQEPARYRVFAYRMYPQTFAAAGTSPLQVPENVRPEPIPEGFRSLGYDVFSRSVENGIGPECSPLSCNGMAAEIPVNEWCLLPSLGAALAVAERFAREQPEPGSYHIAEVIATGLTRDDCAGT